jgi:hypothetical protein
MDPRGEQLLGRDWRRGMPIGLAALSATQQPKRTTCPMVRATRGSIFIASTSIPILQSCGTPINNSRAAAVRPFSQARRTRLEDPELADASSRDAERFCEMLVSKTVRPLREQRINHRFDVPHPRPDVRCPCQPAPDLFFERAEE